MKRWLTIGLISVFSSFLLFGCFGTEEKKEKVPRGLPPVKEVEVFDLANKKPTLILSKNASTRSSAVAYVAPQISGKVTKINVKVGQTVKKNDVLLTLGDSLSTDAVELQNQLAEQNLQLAQDSKELSKLVGDGGVISAMAGAEIALESYKKAVKARDTAEDLFELQEESVELSLDTAEKAYKSAKNNYEDARDNLDDLEDQYDDLKSDPAIDSKVLSDLKKAIVQVEAQVSAAKFAKNSAANAVDQAELGIEQAEEGFDARMEELDFAIQAAYLQYQAAVAQSRNAEYGNQVQQLSLEQQILQISNSLQISSLNLDQKNLRAPIDGVVTSVIAEENNLVGPGQVLVKVEDTSVVSVKTNINLAEATLIGPNTVVKIEADSRKIPAHILTVSPVLRENVGKIEVEILPKASDVIAPGAFVKVNFVIKPLGRIFVPLNSVAIDEDGKFLRIFGNDGLVRISLVTLGQIVDGYVEILEGLKGNEKVIVSVVPRVEEGEKVWVKGGKVVR